MSCPPPLLPPSRFPNSQRFSQVQSKLYPVIIFESRTTLPPSLYHALKPYRQYDSTTTNGGSTFEPGTKMMIINYSHETIFVPGSRTREDLERTTLISWTSFHKDDTGKEVSSGRSCDHKKASVIDSFIHSLDVPTSLVLSV